MGPVEGVNPGPKLVMAPLTAPIDVRKSIPDKHNIKVKKKIAIKNPITKITTEAEISLLIILSPVLITVA